MIYSSRAAALVCILVWLGEQAIATGTCELGKGMAKVEFYVWSTRGQRGTYAVGEFRSVSSGQSYEKAFDQHLTGCVPPGAYDYSLVRAGVKRPRLTTLRGNLVVGKEGTWLAINAPSNVLVGTDGVEGVIDRSPPLVAIDLQYRNLSPSIAKQWVQLVRFEDNFAVARPLDATHRVYVAAMLPGEYTATLIRDGKPIQADIISVSTQPVTRIHIENRSGPRKARSPGN